MSLWHDKQGGVEVIKGTLANEYTIYYDGKLAKSGSDAVYVHYGFGDPDWSSTYNIKMDWTGSRWRKTISAPGHWSMCFKDSAGNWDNNGGLNWSVH